MAVVICPVCGLRFYVRPAIPIDEWLKRYPPPRPGEPSVHECPGCFLELKPRGRVIIRLVPEELAGRVVCGAHGIVTAVDGEGEARGYTVEVLSESGERFSARFTRRELTWNGSERAGPES